ncbi:TetR/AcrR family transcriptional regulator [Nocardia cyriacigeorgica]|uniref:TetR/AcrR family transcriptional regulator n=1 Tax=Nocardia cyriacigeorgica TaxID=135487 RepID=UPI00189626C8|nr:TetR/AcrR family transcriptional regulator [Nocardia cyriacigeorgica]MBF6346335.1 TetR/AcrR family transcriptional regulator [Nocardia cyriacigeorgica]MBF6518347.1 TetR/AcrR family transcriptional regulator [Nocardia cyriacigeorgica]
MTDTRTRLVATTAALLQRQGYESTSVKRIITEAGATYGSLYHFFPDGKEQLAAEALRFGAEDFADLLRRGLSTSDDPSEAIANCALLLADTLRESDWTDGCPVAATALEIIGRSPLIQQTADEALKQWREPIAAKLRDGGMSENAAAALACTVLSTLEGAELLSRVSGDDEPLQIAATHLAVLVRAGLGGH